MPGKDDRGQQQADADAVRVRGEGDLLDHEGTPRVEEDVPCRRQAKQQGDGGQVDRDQDRLQHGNARRLDPVGDEEDDLGDRRVDRRQFRVVHAVQDALEERRHRRVDEELLGGYAVRRTRGSEPESVPQVATEVVLVERTADQSAEAEGDRPEEQSTDRERLPRLSEVEEQAEDRQPGPCDEQEERPQVGLTGLSHERGQGRVPENAPETHPIRVPERPPRGPLDSRISQPTPSSRTRGDRNRRPPGAAARPGSPPTRRPGDPAG